jgi:hypothetical protein
MILSAALICIHGYVPCMWILTITVMLMAAHESTMPGKMPAPVVFRTFISIPTILVIIIDRDSIKLAMAIIPGRKGRESMNAIYNMRM